VTLIADVFAEQPVARHESTIVGTEVGLRYQLTPRIVWDIGVGTEFGAGAAHETTPQTSTQKGETSPTTGPS